MKKSLWMTICLMLFSVPASALDLGVGAKAGLNGVGLDFSVGLTKNLNLRLGVASVDIEGEDETVTIGDDGFEGDVDAELDFDYGSNAILIDWHPFGGGFRLSAGMFRNTGAADLSGTLQSTVVIDGDTLAPSDINGDIGGEVKLADSFQPYLGVGWGRGAGGEGGLSFSVDLGVALLDPEVELEAEVNAGGNFADQDELDQTLRDAESDAEDELDDLEFWPVLAIGVNYAF